jgi:hypothetical protein
MGAHFEAKETFGNSLRAKIAVRGGYASLTNTNGKLSPQSIASRIGAFDETKSVRSVARSLSIVNSQKSGAAE